MSQIYKVVSYVV